MLKEFKGEQYDLIDGVLYLPDHRGRIAANEDYNFVNWAKVTFWFDEYISVQRVIDWYYGKVTFTRPEYREFLDSINRDCYDKRAEDMLIFIMEYDGGIICPNRWNEYEPVNKKFDASAPNDIREVVSALSFPMGSVLFKRVKDIIRCEIEISNGDSRAYFIIEGKGKNKKETLDMPFEVRPRGRTNITIWVKVSELKKTKKTPEEFFDEMAVALKEKFRLYKYYTHIEIDPSFYRKPTKEVIYYDIPETHDDWRDD